MSNVKFVRLTSLPVPFVTATHTGVFVHLTANEMSGGTIVNKAGLWFGGSSNWEYLTNDPNAISDAIAAAIAALDTQVTVATVTSESASSGSGTTFTFKGVKETDGRIEQGDGTGTFTVGDGSLKLSGYGATGTDDQNNPQITTVSATEVFGANDTADSTLAFTNAFVLDFSNNNKSVGIRTNTAVSATNNIATMSDVTQYVGTSMHYVGCADNETELGNLQSGTHTTGDVIVIGTGFTTGGQNPVTYQAGDTLVYNGTSWDAIQGNIDLGVAQGQIAPNTAALTSGNIVVATPAGIQTSSYTPTSIASEAVSVSTANNVTTVSDILTVGGTSQNPQSFTLAGSGVTLSSDGNAITITHDSHTKQDATATGTITFSNGSATFTTVEDTFDAQGHIGTQTTKTWTITLPTGVVNSTDTPINGDHGYSQIIVVNDGSDEEVHLSSTILIGDIENATEDTDGLATAFRVQQYVVGYCDGFVNSITGTNSVSVTATTDSDPTGASYNVDLIWMETI